MPDDDYFGRGYGYWDRDGEWNEHPDAWERRIKDQDDRLWEEHLRDPIRNPRPDSPD